MSIAEVDPGASSREAPRADLTVVRDSTGRYLSEIGQYELIDGREEEVALFKQVEAMRDAQVQVDALRADGVVQSRLPRGLTRAIAEGKSAREEVITRNLRLVVSIAARYPLPKGVEMLDLIQEGNEGLDHAIDKFVWQKGFKFSTYATWWIRQHISRFLAGDALMVPNKAEKHGYYQPRSVNGMQAATDYEQMFGTILSLDAPTGDEGDAELQDFVPDPQSNDGYIQADDKVSVGFQIPGLLSVISETQLEILARRRDGHGQGESLVDIAESFDLTVPQVNAEVRQAKAKLQHPTNAHIVQALPMNETLEDELAWQQDAACYGMGSDLFFPGRGESVKEAKEVCKGCDVRQDCLAWAISTVMKFGIWGGTSERERRDVRKEYNAKKPSK